MKRKLLPFLLMLLTIYLSACNTSTNHVNNGTNTPVFITATLALTSTPRPTATTLPPTPVPTTPPVEGTTTTQVNVRELPSTSSTVLGIIPVSVRVEVTGKDASGTWYQVISADSPKGKGWILATYVQVGTGTEIPVLQMESGTGSSTSGLVIQQVNVRSGPGTEFESLGTLSPNDVVVLTGKDSSGAWLQIEFGSAPIDRGWINATFLQVNGLDSLPVIDEAAGISRVATPTKHSTGTIQTPIPAANDGDSADSPSIRVAFSPSRVRAFQFSGDISSPLGDTEDWMEFTSYGSSVEIQITCFGSSKLHIDVSENGVVLPEYNPVCEETTLLPVKNGEPYLVHIIATEGTQTTTQYIVKVRQLPEP
jgi:uncharacterized protein YraI